MGVVRFFSLLQLPPLLQVPTSSDGEVIDTVESALENSTTADFGRALLILVLSYIMSRVVQRGSTRLIDSRRTHSLLADLFGRVAGYAIVAIGFVYALDTVGVSVGPLLGALGVVGLAAAFALQPSLENLVAGLILQVRRPFDRGDEIESQGYEGEVRTIDGRTMTIRTPDGETVELPNSEVVRGPIVNHSTVGRRMTQVDVAIPYGFDVQHASDVAEYAMQRTAGVLPIPGPRAMAVEFADDGITLTLRFWHRPTVAERWEVRHQVVASVAAAFDRAGIVIPYPQLTLHTEPNSGDPAPTTPDDLVIPD